jgi:hypothetical protein
MGERTKGVGKNRHHINKKPFTIDRASFTPGWYVIEAVTKDKYGEEVKEVAYVQLFNQT